MSQVVCQNCGGDTFVKPQLVLNAQGGTDVFLCCKNCGQPAYLFNEENEEMAQMLAEFFLNPEDGELSNDPKEDG
jgi:hypothetical protein